MKLATESATFARNEKKLIEVLLWVLNWGFSSHSILMLVARTTDRKYVTGLAGNKEEKEKTVEVEGKEKSKKKAEMNEKFLDVSLTNSCQPRKLFKLSREGFAFAIRKASALEWHPGFARFRSCAIPLTNVLHDLTCQFLTLSARHAETICAYESAYMIGKTPRSDRNFKHPDVVWVLRDGARVAIEYERTWKSGDQMKNFVFNIAMSLDPENVGSDGKYQRFVIFVESKVFAHHYKEAISRLARQRLPFDPAPAQWSDFVAIIILEDEL